MWNAKCFQGYRKNYTGKKDALSFAKISVSYKMFSMKKANSFSTFLCRITLQLGDSITFMQNDLD